MFNWKRTTTADWTPADLQARLSADEQLLVLDVRQPDEYREGHVRGSVLIPLDQVALRSGELPRDRPIAVICRSGNRSGVATAMLHRAGFDAHNVAGGILRWQREGLPVERGR